MQTIFASRDEAREALTTYYGVSEKNVDALFDAVGAATESLIDDYDLYGEVDTEAVQRWLQIGSAEKYRMVCRRRGIGCRRTGWLHRRSRRIRDGDSRWTGGHKAWGFDATV